MDNKVDLNCDMGEGFGVYRFGFDEEVMPYVTSANLACGFHASDPMTMLRAIRLAKKHGVAVGAHPSFPDRVGFGRRLLGASPDEIRADVIYQIGALAALCRSEGVGLTHVKAHGALYNLAARDVDVATAIAEAVKSTDWNLTMICLTGSRMTEAARKTGLRCREEVFADRGYTRQGTLVPRNLPGAIVHDVGAVVSRVLLMVREGKVLSVDGEEVPVSAETICVHADTPGAVDMIRAIRQTLEREGLV
jgi:UPF0271 protein